MSEFPLRSENQATNMLPSRARSTLGSSSLPGLPVESRRGSVGSNVGADDDDDIEVESDWPHPASVARAKTAIAHACFTAPPSARLRRHRFDLEEPPGVERLGHHDRQRRPQVPEALPA